jgi:hypothetical protein
MTMEVEFQSNGYNEHPTKSKTTRIESANPKVPEN